MQLDRYEDIKKQIMKKLPPKSSTANFIPGLNISSSLFVEPLRFSDGIDLQWSAATSGSKANSKLFGLMPAYIQWKYHIIMYLLAIGEKGTCTFLTQDKQLFPEAPKLRGLVIVERDNNMSCFYRYHYLLARQMKF